MNTNKKLYTLLIFISFISAQEDIPQYYCTAANSHYFKPLLNLIGGIHLYNFDHVQEIAVFDLGLTSMEIRQLQKIKKVTIHKVEITHPDILKFFYLPRGGRVLGWFAWKPVVIKQSIVDLHFPYVLWLDAGTTVMANLNHLFAYLKEHDYFICTIGDEIDPSGNILHPVKWGLTKYVKDKFNLNGPESQWLLDAESIMGGILGASHTSLPYLFGPLYELTKDITNYQDDGTTPSGWGTARHDQTLLSILAYGQGLKVHQQDHTLQIPILLDIGNNQVPLWITWNGKFVCDKTQLYSSRGVLNHRYLAAIQHKSRAEIVEIFKKHRK